MSFTTFGEIMLRLSPSDHAAKINTARSFGVHYAGSESNVASALALMGNEVQFITKLPENQIGDGALQSLQAFGISTKNILRGGNRMGTYFIEIGSSIRPSSVIYDRAGSSISELKKGEFDWETLLKDQQWLFVSGITPALSTSCAEETIRAVEAAKRLGVKVAFDMNYRRTLWKQEKEARVIFDKILSSTDLLFGNSGVLKDVYDLDSASTDPIEKTKDLIKKAKLKFGVSQLAFTVREHRSASQNQLSGIFMADTDPILSEAYTVEILDRFGTGDAFAAATLHGLAKGWATERTIGFAAAAFALKHTIKGDQHTSTETEIYAIYEGNTSGHVIR